MLKHCEHLLDVMRPPEQHVAELPHTVCHRNEGPACPSTLMAACGLAPVARSFQALRAGCCMCVNVYGHLGNEGLLLLLDRRAAGLGQMRLQSELAGLLCAWWQSTVQVGVMLQTQARTAGHRVLAKPCLQLPGPG